MGYFAVVIIRSPQNPILIIKAPTLRVVTSLLRLMLLEPAKQRPGRTGLVLGGSGDLVSR